VPFFKHFVQHRFAESSAAQVRSTSVTQSITLQYQTAQGTRIATIPNGQIRHLPGTLNERVDKFWTNSWEMHCDD